MKLTVTKEQMIHLLRDYGHTGADQDTRFRPGAYVTEINWTDRAGHLHWAALSAITPGGESIRHALLLVDHLPSIKILPDELTARNMIGGQP